MYKLYINKQLVFSSDNFDKAENIRVMLKDSSWSEKLSANLHV